MHILFINWNNVKQNCQSQVFLYANTSSYSSSSSIIFFLLIIKARRFTIHTYARTKCYVLSSPAYLYTPSCVCRYMYTHTRTRVHIHMYIHTHAYTYRVYTHTHTHTSRSVTFFFFLKLCAYARVWIVHQNERTSTHYIIVSYDSSVHQRYHSSAFTIRELHIFIHSVYLIKNLLALISICILRLGYAQQKRWLLHAF